ncbi:Peroxidase-like [Hyalella azteca]|nr:Peroxidase-like [Hyalella azteca]
MTALLCLLAVVLCDSSEKDELRKVEDDDDGSPVKRHEGDDASRNTRHVFPLSRVDGPTFARGLAYQNPTPSFSGITSFNQHFNRPVVFPPHSPSAHLTSYSPFSATPTILPTSPLQHANSGVSNFLGSNGGYSSRGQATIRQLHPVTTLHNVAPVVGHNRLDFPEAEKTEHHQGVGSSCRGHTTCSPLVSCAACFSELDPYDKCELEDGHFGVCCPPSPSPNAPNRRVFAVPNIFVKTPDISLYQLNEAAKAGLWEVAERDKLEQVLRTQDIVVSNPKSPEYRHLQFFKTSPRAMKFGRAAITVERSTVFLMKKFYLTSLQAGYGLRRFSVRDTILSDTCPEEPYCGEKEEYYRTIDGSCNNIRNPRWGQAKTALNRILPAHYEDGVFEPRGGISGRQLPSARVVSISNVADVDMPDPELTLSVMQMGQFIDHDLTSVPIFRFGNESGIQCCNDGAFVDPSMTHPACFPVEIPTDDPFFSRFGRRCMNFVRSMPTQNENCTFGSAQQMNQITHFLDGSNVYASSVEDERSIRAGRGGLLNVQGPALLPADPSASENSCDALNRGFDCFLAGDNRVNEQPDLAVIHTIFMREHNRLALQLAKINPQWDDETLYQEARRINVAQMQHIIYNEWLPIILGKDCMVNNLMLPRPDGFSRDYDPNVNAAIRNEFAAAAFRFGHTLVQGMFQLFGKNHQPTEKVQLHEHFNSPHLLYTPGKLDEFLRGLAKQPIQKFDNFVTEDLTNRLFQGMNNPFGMDLVALNIQRGRDHGIPPYNALREACGLPRARSFEDLLDVMPGPVVQRLSGVYDSVDDIDLFIAGIAERPVPGAVLGPTFKCIVADQFMRLRRGDRFFYEHGGLPNSFTEAQLREIKQTSWARIMCDNGDHIKAVQPLAMRLPGKLNMKVPCDSASIPKLDLTPWISVPY